MSHSGIADSDTTMPEMPAYRCKMLHNASYGMPHRGQRNATSKSLSGQLRPWDQLRHFQPQKIRALFRETSQSWSVAAPVQIPVRENAPGVPPEHNEYSTGIAAVAARYATRMLTLSHPTALPVAR